jgi:hypothetical protein
MPAPAIQPSGGNVGVDMPKGPQSQERTTLGRISIGDMGLAARRGIYLEQK